MAEFAKEAGKTRPLQAQSFGGSRLVAVRLQKGRSEQVALEVENGQAIRAVGNAFRVLFRKSSRRMAWRTSIPLKRGSKDRAV